MICNIRAAKRGTLRHTVGAAERLAERELQRELQSSIQRELHRERHREVYRSSYREAGGENLRDRGQLTSRLVSCEVWSISTYLLVKEE